MKTITVKEALEQGYDLCGYDGLENQMLINISDLTEDDFSQHHGGNLCVAKKNQHSASIDVDETIDWLTDRYYDFEGNPDDDVHDMELYFKEEKETIEKFVNKMNEIYAKKWWRFLDSDLQLVPNETVS